MGLKVGKNPAWFPLALAGAMLCCCAPARGQTTRPQPPPRTPGEAAFFTNTAPSTFFPPTPASTVMPGLIAESRVVADSLPIYSLMQAYLGPDAAAFEQHAKNVETILSVGVQMLQPGDDLIHQVMALMDTAGMPELRLEYRTGLPAYTLSFDLPVHDPFSLDTQLWIHDIEMDPVDPDVMNQYVVAGMVIASLLVIFLGYRLVLRGRRGLPQEWEY